jgi:IS30 family transposase
MRDKSAASLTHAAVRTFKPIPVLMRNTLTVDNGKEFAAHRSLSQALELDIFFAHPYHSWERGLNEQADGLTRQCLPKKYRLTCLLKNSLTKLLPGSIIVPARF